MSARNVERLTLLGLLALLLIAMNACAGMGRHLGTGRSEHRQSPVPSIVRVTNHNWATAAVYVYLDGRSIRLGDVETGGTSAWVLPASARAATDVEVVAELIGTDQTYSSGTVLISSAQLIRVTIENSLPLSSVTVEDQ